MFSANGRKFGTWDVAWFERAAEAMTGLSESGSLGAQRDKRIDLCRAARREESGDEHAHEEQPGHDDEAHRIMCGDAVEKRPERPTRHDGDRQTGDDSCRPDG